jgi:hypothetical protein
VVQEGVKKNPPNIAWTPQRSERRRRRQRDGRYECPPMNIDGDLQCAAIHHVSASV